MVTLLADLGHLEDHLTQMQASPYGQGGQLDSFGGDVLGKVSASDLDALAPHGLDILVGQKRYLPVPGPGVGIPFDAVIRPKHRLLHRSHLHPFSFRRIDGED